MAQAVLFYNATDFAPKHVEVKTPLSSFVENSETCRREFLLTHNFHLWTPIAVISVAMAVLKP